MTEPDLGASHEPPGALRVLVVAADRLMRAGLGTVLRNEPGIVVIGEALPEQVLPSTLLTEAPNLVVLHVDADRLDDARPVMRVLEQAGVAMVLVGLPPSTPLPGGVRAVLAAVSPADALVAAVRLAGAGYSMIADPASAMPAEQALAITTSLTEREHEVLRLMAQGLTNLQIAQKLVLSEHTVKTHVRNVLRKLRLHSRVQTVSYAYESGLLRRPD